MLGCQHYVSIEVDVCFCFPFAVVKLLLQTTVLRLKEQLSLVSVRWACILLLDNAFLICFFCVRCAACTIVAIVCIESSTREFVCIARKGRWTVVSGCSLCLLRMMQEERDQFLAPCLFGCVILRQVSDFIL